MTRSAESVNDMQPSKDEVKISNETLIDVECYGSLTVFLPNRAGGVTVRLERVAYVPNSAFNLFSWVATHTRGVDFSTDDSDKSVTPLDGSLGFRNGDFSHSTHGRRTDTDDDCISSPSLVPDSVETQCNQTSLFRWRSL